MKHIIIASSLVLFLSAGNAQACDKWKSEIVKLGWKSKEYYNLYGDYKNDTIAKAAFLLETESLISDLNDLESYVQSTESCEHPKDKFEKRKTNLLSFISKAVLVMRAGEFVKIFKHKD